MVQSMRELAAAAGFVGAAGLSVLTGAAVAGAQPLPPPPPGCSAADLAGVASGVTAATSAYLFTHPEVNAFFTSLSGLPKEEVRTRVADYAVAHPQVKAELRGIRQPMVDFRNRCGGTPVMADGPMAEPGS